VSVVARAIAVLAAGAVMAWPIAARADDVRADLQGYYGGERTSAYVVGGIGAGAAVAGGVLVTRDSDLARGLGWPWLVMGSLETVGAVLYAFQVGGEIDHYDGELARDPAAYRAEELDHLRGTSSRFVIYRAVEIALAVGGASVAIGGLAAHRDAYAGVGLGVASLALPFVVIDTFNDSRASRYLDRVRRYDPAVGLAPSVGAEGARGWTLSLSGRF
jgi:hypothetical protein